MNKLILLALVLMQTAICAQTKEDALRDARITSEATLKMDFKTVLKHTLPKVVDIMGGEDAALTLLNSTFDSMKSQGFVFEKADIKTVSEIVKEQDQYRCFVEGYNQMTMAGQRIKSNSYLLGIYNDAEGFWWFIEAKQLKNTAMLDQVIPGFKTELEIPEDKVETEVMD